VSAEYSYGGDWPYGRQLISISGAVHDESANILDRADK
jgi:hypothetical protein